jgi:hypothetical protein
VRRGGRQRDGHTFLAARIVRNSVAVPQSQSVTCQVSQRKSQPVKGLPAFERRSVTWNWDSRCHRNRASRRKPTLRIGAQG